MRAVIGITCSPIILFNESKRARISEIEISKFLELRLLVSLSKPFCPIYVGPQARNKDESSVRGHAAATYLVIRVKAQVRAENCLEPRATRRGAQHARTRVSIAWNVDVG